MKIYLASDHAGFELKEHLKPYLEGLGFDVKDCGAREYDKGDDYPDFIVPAAEGAAEKYGNMAVVIGGSGQGEAMAANKVSGARAAVFYGGNLDAVKLSREHNDANVLALGARLITQEEAEKAVRLWLGTPFSKAERHVRRIDTLNEIP